MDAARDSLETLRRRHVDGNFFDPLRVLLELAVSQRFIGPEHRDMVLVESDPEALLDRLSSWTPVTVDKWLDRSQR